MVEFKKAIEHAWPGVLEIVTDSQTALSDIYRWGKYADTGIRKQNDLEHSFSITILASIIMAKICDHTRPIDRQLVLNAFLVHDYGEGLLGRDICLVDKTGHDDIDEYKAFINKFSVLDKRICNQFHRAYLLQYITSERPDFPPEAQAIMEELRENRMLEALIFMAVETLEYILYALEQHGNGHKTILAEVLANAEKRIAFLKNNLCGFKEAIWTEEIEKAIQKT